MEQALAEFIRSRRREIYPEPLSDGHSQITAAMAREVVKYLPQGASILDIGCGQGPALEWFTREGFNPIGITLGSDAETCRAKGFNVVETDMHDLPKVEVDCIWARHVLEHSVAPLFALHQWRSVLKPQGILYVELPGEGTACAHHTNKNHYSIFTRPVWMELIQRAGFQLIEVRDIAFQTGAGPDVYYSLIARNQ